MLSISMADNVISCKKIKRNAQENKIAGFTIKIRLNVAETLVVFPRMSSIDWIYLIYSEWIGNCTKHMDVRSDEKSKSKTAQHGTHTHCKPLQTMER